MQKCNKNVENGVKNIQPVNQSLVLLMPRPSAPSLLERLIKQDTIKLKAVPDDK